MAAYFVDTWFFIAYLRDSDSHHHTAMRLVGILHDASFVTHDGVLTELLAFFCSHGDLWRKHVAAFVRDALHNKQFEIVPLTRHLFEEALTLYERRLDKQYSLIDCASMIVMRQYGIQHVLTNDHHFAQEGFTLLNA
ncbi:MAG TPA: PIN domain-containing protein [Thermoanaerobaculia bacterium]|nr:PIN domain-containing protein [Thermoanaerobaculia bacterium]